MSVLPGICSDQPMQGRFSVLIRRHYFSIARDSGEVATASGMLGSQPKDASGGAADLLVCREHLPCEIGQAGRGGPSRAYRTQ